MMVSLNIGYIPQTWDLNHKWLYSDYNYISKDGPIEVHRFHNMLGVKTTKYIVNFIDLKDEIKMIANIIIDYLP